MLSIANKVFRDFKEFYNEINAATLTGAIDVIAVEQPDGTYHCSPFHVRFGKLGVLRSREKIVDIEINGEPVDIHMKLGESGEAFFVEECSEGDEELPHHMATSPIPSNELTNYEDTISASNANNNELKIPLPRRNSVDLGSKDISETETTNKFENQTSDFTLRRHTDNDLVRRDLISNKIEFTTQKLRQEFPEEQDQLYDEIKEKFNLRRMDESHQFRPITEDGQNDSDKSSGGVAELEIEGVLKSDQKEKSDDCKNLVKDDNKSSASQQSKKKRRKKSMIKKKNSQRKNSSSSSAGSVNSDIANETEVIENNSGIDSQDPSPNTENDIVKDLSRDDEVVTSERDRRDHDIHFFSDGELGSGISPQQSRPSTPIQSDTEFEVSQREKSENAMKSSASWKWGDPVVTTSDDRSNNANNLDSNKRNSMLSGMLSFMKQKRKSIPDGLYLSDLDPETMDPEVAALYFPQSNDTNDTKETKSRDDDRESGNGTSLPQSPTTSMELIKCEDIDDDEKQQADTSLNFVSLSLCGGMEKGGPSDEEFESNIVQYSDICHNPALFSSPNLVVRLNNKYYSWMTACPVVMTLLAYQKPLPNDICEKLLLHDLPKPKSKDDSQQQQQTQAESRRSWFSWRRSGGGSVQDSNKKTDLVDGVATQTSPMSSPQKTIKENQYGNGSVSSEDSFQQKNLDGGEDNLNTEKFRKTLRLSSQQIEKLNLKSGMNEVEFSVTTAYQGTSRCKCYLFKWKHSDKVVISDIDGTITKSDVLGHILPMVGKDWAQIGVAQLFSKIEENGYKMLYLSARAIGQSRATREYLRSIRQGDVQLPDGPLLLNPTSLISAFHREVIERKPEQFKIECLSDIKSLFTDKNPFYAGYGNRINDVWAYRAVGIPIMRIYTINPRGELKHELTQTFQSTYCSMTYIVDQLFPPIKLTDDDDCIEYTSFNYWRDPVCDVDFDVSGSSTPENSNASLQAIQSKPLATIPEN
ncbi:CLUMA_CG001557, isoform A [Clunio marinus]|uniref:phosphatidate phosphatase n=1 Tax=Clunio marinus TaxID=568069 RepID=A0A1J1HNG4_9DIPT|nr:CLUMA_CG001557, isoform A [Clunio marinus]